MIKGDKFQVEVEVLKVKKGVATVIKIGADTYILQNK